jgi:hypothetical protein
VRDSERVATTGEPDANRNRLHRHGLGDDFGGRLHATTATISVVPISDQQMTRYQQMVIRFPE